MATRLALPPVKRSFTVSGLTRYKNRLVLLLAILLLFALCLFWWRPAAVPDLAHDNVAGVRAMTSSWAKGDTIVLVRHVERCARPSAPGRGPADGITDRAREVAVAIGARFEHLGLERTDIYNSPMTRTAQTAGYMFSKVSSGDGWLYNCKGNLLRDVLAHKVPGRNLVLVTHSECMDELETELNLATPTLGYGASLFITTDTLNGAPKMLGMIEASDWRSVNLKP
ncbi:histidine phosphatase family protein [Pseudomonas sp. TKO26]|uniref:lipopolysaccharide core heptose(II)-phosphate phosphatase PmrG n=1 Tax=unclassified Pseudomonas TaxID=196821 RepID=UPI000D96D5DB|nr:MULTISPECIES: histidine phosphatase family protein [unclassified Pseudomonas]PYY90407.1 histidine phosphatase family protein [Pseudomonas sp. TKO30]PYY93279.1 histidine phosphatase family protein [Pseudomonas sp. TKO29]PYY95507.1 histidine phosphatase family protein [Pseudomonas sp. TKO26]